jgi:hypothetical protein
MNKNNSKKPVHNSAPTVVDFGTRAIVNQNFSRLIALPKTALTNLGENIAKVNVTLVQESENRYIKISAINEVETK